MMQKIETTLQNVVNDIKKFYDYKKHFYSMVNGVDRCEGFEIQWLFGEYHGEEITMFVANCGYEDEVPSLASFIPSSVYSENELFDLMGVKFHGAKRGLFIEKDTKEFPLRCAQ